jgi:hydrogenase nickel incorporation protein HypA/HybF
MHEASIAAELLQVVEEQARAHGLVRVTRLALRVGAMRAVVPELLRTAFEVMAQGGLAEGARLDLELVPLHARCGPCGLEVDVQDFVFLCPACGQPLREILTGKEMDLMHLEGEAPDAAGPEFQLDQGEAR